MLTNQPSAVKRVAWRGNGTRTVDALNVITEEQIAQIPETQEQCRPLSRSALNLDPPDHTRPR